MAWFDRFNRTSGQTVGRDGQVFALTVALFDQGKVLTVRSKPGMMFQKLLYRHLQEIGDGIDLVVVEFHRPFPAAAFAAPLATERHDRSGSETVKGKIVALEVDQEKSQHKVGKFERVNIDIGIEQETERTADRPEIPGTVDQLVSAGHR